MVRSCPLALPSAPPIAAADRRRPALAGA